MYMHENRIEENIFNSSKKEKKGVDKGEGELKRIEAREKIMNKINENIVDDIQVKIRENGK
jgi:hypothetical protein